MNYYKDNIYSIIHTIPNIPFLLIFLIIIFFVVGFYLLNIELYDSKYFYAIKYNDQDYLEVLAPLELSEDILKYEVLEIDKKQIDINTISLLTPKKEQIYNDVYNIASIKLSDYEDIPSETIIKVKLLKNKQSILKKILS
ncbi:MAG: hypothetical protein ACI31M_03840 [Bacilli bacterium]